jgi:hypothetical protein
MEGGAKMKTTDEYTVTIKVTNGNITIKVEVNEKDKNVRRSEVIGMLEIAKQILVKDEMK